MAPEKPSWEEYFTYLALGVSMRSKDPKSRVGCVIVNSDTLKILSIGYNGFYPGISNSDENWSDEKKDDLVVHAEANAVLLKGTANLENSVAFVTLFPCEECAKMLIQAGVRKVYYLSFRDKYRKSEEIFKAANVELVPIKRGDDGTLTMFEDRFIKVLKEAISKGSNMDIDCRKQKLYDQQKEKTKKLRRRDIEGPWQRDTKPGERSDQILFKKWTDYYLFLAHVASTRSSSDVKEGALLIDSKTFKMCSLSYKGYPRGVEGASGKNMMVSAIMNVLALRFCDGNKFHTFCTNFPEEREVKNLAQAKVERLYFISPSNLTEKALSILDDADVEIVPMNPLNETNIWKEIRTTFEGLAKKEEGNETSFKNWPKVEWTSYELEPKRHNSGLAFGKAIGISIGIGLAGIGIGSRIPIIRNSIIRISRSFRRFR